MSKRILVTGSEGTLGKVLRKELESRGHLVHGLDLAHNNKETHMRVDLTEHRQVQAAFEWAEPDVVFHLGAEFGRNNGDQYYEQLWSHNCIGTRNVIENCIDSRAHLVFASSSEAYGTLSDGNAMHEDLLKTHVPSFCNEYALSKWANEKQVEIAVNHHGLKATILRFFNAYGPGEFYSPYRSVVCLFIYRLLHNLPITLYKDYHRVFMYVDDWARTVANVADVYPSLRNGDVFNIGGDEYRSVEFLKDLILNYIPYSTSEIEVLAKEEANITNKRPDISKAVEQLGHKLTIPLEEGIPLTIDWQKSIYGIA